MKKQNEEDNLSPYSVIRREVRKVIPDAENSVIDQTAAQTIHWWFNTIRLIGNAYGNKKNLVIPREAFDKWSDMYDL